MKSVRIDDLDSLAQLYGRFSRSLRLCRGFVAIAVLAFLAGIPVNLSLALFDPTVGVWTVANLLITLASVALHLSIAGFLVLLYVNWYIGIAACSVFSLRAAIIIGGFYLFLPVLGLSILALAHGNLANGYAAAIAFAVFFLFFVGLHPLLASARAKERRIFATQLGECRFFRPFGMLIRDLCRFSGLLVGSRLFPQKKVAAAAVMSAFLLEGVVYNGYNMLSRSQLERAMVLPAFLYEDRRTIDQTKWRPYLRRRYLRDPFRFLIGVPLFFVLVVPLVFGVAGYLRRFGLRRSMRNAELARVEDSRPPILFLRSFRDDQVTLSKAPLPLPLRFFDPGTQAGTLEGLLVRVMTSVGPVIAVGNPGEPIAPIGVARTYITNRPWEDVVSDLIREARLIIVGLDATPGVRWELNEIAAQGALEKTLVIVPPRLAGKGELSLGILASAGIVPTGIATVGGNDIGFLFEPAETLVALRSSLLSEIEYEVALRLALSRVPPPLPGLPR